MQSKRRRYFALPSGVIIESVLRLGYLGNYIISERHCLKKSVSFYSHGAC